MGINKRTSLLIIGLLLFTFILSSCAAKHSMDNSPTYEQNSAGTGHQESESGHYDGIDYEEEGLDPGIANINIEPEKIITNIHISLETTEFDSSVDSLDNLIKTNKGFVENSDISLRNYSNNRVLKHGDYTIRIPQDRADKFVNEIDSIGNIVSQNTSREDITKQYYDTESRLKLLEIKEERMTAILEKADKIEDIIAIENQLSEIIHQKENLNKNILDMDERVAYSTVYLYISEVEKLGSNISSPSSFSSRFSRAISDSLYMFRVALEGFAIVFVYLVPYLLIGGIIGFFVFKFIKKRKEG